MLTLAFPRSRWHYEILNLVTLDCLLLGPTLWRFNGSILSLVVSFFGGSLTRAEVCLAPSKRSFRYHANTFLFMCRSRGKHLVINLFYHTYISFILNPFLYSITYLSWLATSYCCPFFIVLVWSYHWWSSYPFSLVPLWEWTYNSPPYISGYYRSYYFEKWSTYSEGRLSPFPLPHLTTSGYPYH